MVKFAGTDDRDDFFGTVRKDVIFGLGGDDWLYGRGGNDRIVGGRGNDVLFGEEGRDTINGGRGDDIVYTGSGVVGRWEIVRGGGGNDRLFLGDGGYIDGYGVPHDVGNVRAFGGAGDDELRAGMGVNWLSGGAGNDYLQAPGGFLSGDAGDDTLYGSGNVELVGGDGNDRLNAYLAGSATVAHPFGWLEPVEAHLSGGFGADIFSVRAVGDAYSSIAYVSDFRPEEGDRIDLSAYVAADAAGGSRFYFSREIFAAFDTGADGLTADGKLDLGDTASGAVTLSPGGWLTIHVFGDRVVFENGPSAVADWMLA